MALPNLTAPPIHRIYNSATDRPSTAFPYLLLLLHGAQPPRPPLFLGFRVLFYSDFCACPFEKFPKFRSGWRLISNSEVWVRSNFVLFCLPSNIFIVFFVQILNFKILSLTFFSLYISLSLSLDCVVVSWNGWWCCGLMGMGLQVLVGRTME